ncbi:hypothetical protein T492DRAFT_336778 [Pavlovales sp. CCMP2436]|nr:hypothetical protein T492DRAFT_336778 [Pavlovales sp. CCMP2436]|mmetsp:Transcript_42155/g.98889  ORF Transcript_42155/g.98889 Transcript_42155/m.98889 type:complete len:282 (+) Transcript_42155:3637-4482(+)
MAEPAHVIPGGQGGGGGGLPCSECLAAKATSEYTAAQLKKKGSRRCIACVEGPARGHGSGSDSDSDDDEDDERPELRAALVALQIELADASCTAERRASATAELADLEETLRDLEEHEELQHEIDKLEQLKGPARMAAKARMSAIEKKLDQLEAKHATKQLGAQPVEAPAGITFLGMEQAAPKLAVLVSGEAWVRHQCALSHKLALSKPGGKGALPMLIDSSANGRARRAGLGQVGTIVEVDRKDASAKVRFASGNSVWFPVAALSDAAAAAACASAPIPE